MKPAGIILAAGESSRMGTDKALLLYRGSTFLDHLAGLFLSYASPVVVVLGHNAEKIRAALKSRPEIVVNPSYKSGQLSSLQTGIRALPRDCEAALLTLVDHPAVAASTLETMLERFTPPLLIPRYRGRRGHPILVGRTLLDEILALPVLSSAKQVVHAHLSDSACLDVDDPGVVIDVDTPEEFRRITGALGRRE